MFQVELDMSKANRLFNSIVAFVVFLFSCTRVAIARIWHAPQKPPTAKVFALTEAAWLELRSGGAAAQAADESKSRDHQKEQPKSSEDKKEAPKSGDDKKQPPKSADSDKGRSEGGEDKSGAPKAGEGEQGPGGGDGDMGGSGG